MRLHESEICSKNVNILLHYYDLKFDEAVLMLKKKTVTWGKKGKSTDLKGQRNIESNYTP